jgi:hypothetical protein
MLAQDGIEQRFQIWTQLRGEAGLPGDGIGVDYRELCLLVVGAQLDEQVKGLVHHALRVGIFAVDLVDHYNRPVAHSQRFFEHKAGLRHGTVGGIHQQQHAVHHVHHPLHFAAKIGVPGRIHNVDLDLLVGLGIPDVDGGVLRQDGDAPLALQIVGVHDPYGDLLVLAEDARLAQQPIHQRGLAMV